MFDQSLQLLTSSDAAQRRQAIIKLADCDDPRAISYLEKASQQDPDPALRSLAQKAKMHAERRQWRQATESNQPDTSATATTSGSTADSAEVTQHQEMARTYLSSAIGARANGDRASALMSLVRALELDPDLDSDPEVISLAVELTGEAPQKAVSALISGKVKGKARSPQGVGSLSAMIVIEALLLFVALTAAVLIYFMMIRQNPSAFFRVPGFFASSQTAQLLSYRDALMRVPVSAVFGTAALTGAVTVIVVLIVDCMMFVGGVIIGGTGTIFDFVNMILRVQVVLTGIETILVIIVFVIGSTSVSVSKDVSSLLTTLSGILSFAGLVAMPYYAAKVHDFGIPRGFATVISPVLMACGCLFLVAFLH